MAALTERGEIPVCAVALIVVKVVYREHVAGWGVVWVAAALTLPAFTTLDRPGDFSPVVRILACESAHYSTSVSSSSWSAALSL